MWKELWIIMIILAFILLAVSIVLAFLWDILNIIDELSGRKAKRQIKILKDMNADTRVSRLSTNEIFGDIPSGVFQSEELSNLIASGMLEKSDFSENIISSEILSREDIVNKVSENIGEKISVDSDDIATSFLSDEDDEDDISTSFLSEDDSTSFLDISAEDVNKFSLSIKIIEEQSSLKGV